MSMLLIVGVFICITSAASDLTNDTNSTYVLAKVLFYSDAKGQIVFANGPVPTTANLAIRDDVITRINETSVRVVSVYNYSKEIPKTLNIFKLIKDEQKPIFVTKVKKRLTRTIKDWWDNLWGLNNKKAGRSKKKITVDYNRTATSLKPSVKKDQSTIKGKVVKKKKNMKKEDDKDDAKAPTAGGGTTDGTHGKSIENHETQHGKQNDTKGEDSDTGKHGNKENQEIKEKKVPKAKNITKFVKVTSTTSQDELLNSLEAYDYFIPNQIYYSVEKRCVNWSDICDVQTGARGFLNMSTSNFKYFFKRPKFSQNGPIID